jgi:hypothetical protein
MERLYHHLIMLTGSDNHTIFVFTTLGDWLRVFPDYFGVTSPFTEAMLNAPLATAFWTAWD